jgi:hypothetical protein
LHAHQNAVKRKLKWAKVLSKAHKRHICTHEWAIILQVWFPFDSIDRLMVLLRYHGVPQDPCIQDTDKIGDDICTPAILMQVYTTAPLRHQVSVFDLFNDCLFGRTWQRFVS